MVPNEGEFEDVGIAQCLIILEEDICKFDSEVTAVPIAYMLVYLDMSER